MSNAVIPREGQAQDQSPKAAFSAIEGVVEAKREAIVRTLPATIDPDMFINVALQAVTRTPLLLRCTPQSIVKALRDAAEVGLVPSGLLGSAYLVPYFNGSPEVKAYEAQFQAGYRGLIDLARRSGEVRLIEAHVVRERDRFEFAYGTEGFIRHVPYMNFAGEVSEEGQLLDGGKYIAAYARAVLTSGEEQFEVMSLPEIEAIRRRSKAANNGPWVTDWAEMARKTPTRRLLKYLPLAVSALTRALELEDAAEQREAPTTVRVVNPQRTALAASLGLSERAQATESGDAGEVEHGAAAEPVAASGPSEGDNGAVGAVCLSPHPEQFDVLCQRPTGHAGSHADDEPVSAAEMVWPNHPETA